MNTRRLLAAVAAIPALVLTTAVVGDAAINTATSSVAPATPALVLDAAQLTAGSLQGKKIYLDPGHNGANDESINKQVPTGRGGTKPCQTTGTEAITGLPEHTFNYQVSYRLYQVLTAAGAQVMMSRLDDTSVASCIDVRAQQANQWGADAIVSVHADGSAPGNRGFHVNYSSPPVNEVQRATGPAYAATMRDALVSAGFTPATYIGTDGVYGRSDLAGLNLATVPAVLVEAGNLKDPSDAALLSSAAGQQRLAQALAAGVADFVTGTPAAVR